VAKQVIVTGNSGIAAALIRALDARGDAIYIVGGVDAESETLSNECKNVKGFSSVDLREEEQSVSAFTSAERALGKITDVVGIVGGSGRKFGDGRVEEISLDAWNRTLALNLSTAFLTLREGVKLLKKSGGSITLTGSVLATSPVKEHFTTHAYATSKAALEGLVRVSAASYLEEKIRINAVAPGLVDTPMAKRAGEDPVVKEFTAQKQPLAGGQLPATALTSAYLYLIDNQFVTGEVLTVDGGWRSMAN
jgi:NAD(P)-dependent dehydrogenase (short-subunit alcohol dehydrogenase family)